ncbi:hypothetical protein LXA43DRAFT_109536 [Ganoderma leucocontextum]|nr:hypothetical protein LXA43DRAFT_109536 [Ganoderma leucocontextum]
MSLHIGTLLTSLLLSPNGGRALLRSSLYWRLTVRLSVGKHSETQHSNNLAKALNQPSEIIYSFTCTRGFKASLAVMNGSGEHTQVADATTQKEPRHYVPRRH